MRRRGWSALAARCPLSKMAFSDAVTLDPVKVAALIVVTEELLQSAAPGAESSFGRELRGAVADTVDETFISILTAGIPPSTSTANALDDLEGMLNRVNTTGAGNLFWVMVPGVANRMATKTATNGNQLFPAMTPTGGEILGRPALVTNRILPVGSPSSGSMLLLVDATGIAADTGEVEIDISRGATIEMSDNPAQSAMTPTHAQMVSLFQTNSVGLLARVEFGCARLRDNAVAVLEQIAW